MVSVQLLEPEDIIEPDDWVRRLGRESSPCPTYTQFNRATWTRTFNACPYWVGKTVGAYNTFHSHPGNDFDVDSEFIRGDIPLSHVTCRQHGSNI